MNSTLLSFEAAMIKKIPLCHMDALTWPFNPTGEYSVKSDYKFLREEFQNSQPGQFEPEYLKPLWQAIWSFTSSE